MLGAIYTGLSGLQAYSDGLEKVSNNVTNLNSLGYKASSVTFSNVQGARDTGGLGLVANGSNSAGVELAKSRLDMRDGQLRQTGNDLDLAVDGTGFLVLLRGSEVRYGRTGSFEIDKDGFVVLSGTDWRLATLDASGRPAALSVDASRTNSPAKTQLAKFADNLSSTATAHSVNDLSVYDATGAKHVWQVSFARSEGSTDWQVKVVDDKGVTIGEKTLSFALGAPTEATKKLLFADNANGLSVTFDFSSSVSSFSSGTVSTLRAAEVDGHGTGSIVSLAVNGKGELEIGYSNNEKKQLGAVALASFRDPGSLRQETGGLIVADGTADVAYLSSEDTRVGAVLSRRLEASNVDLSSEFGDLILIQRGYQASSQIISVANDMIQQLFGIRGQG